MKIQGYNIPEDLHYDKDHFWVKVDGDLLVMGMNDFAQTMAGDIVYVQLPPEGKKLTLGKKFAKIESGKWLGKVYAPVNGVLHSANQALEVNPGLINEDCYDRGWMYKIKADDPGEIGHLITGAEAIEPWLLADIKKYADHD